MSDAEEMNYLKAENNFLRQKLSAICKVYLVLRPVLKFAKFFSFIKKGAAAAIEATIAVLDEACKIK